jgi:hypothetical protein
MSTTETAHDKILAWCRSKPRGMGLPCMRTRTPNRVAQGEAACVIVDNSSWDSPVLFKGTTWEEVLVDMENQGAFQIASARR